jgi:hypothetical protein
MSATFIFFIDVYEQLFTGTHLSIGIQGFLFCIQDCFLFIFLKWIQSYFRGGYMGTFWENTQVANEDY